jgi:signal transduction histidine kinase
MMHSLQARLTWAISGVLSVILVGAGLLLYGVQRNALIDEFDAGLNLTSVTLMRLVEFDGKTVKSEMSEEEFPQFSRGDRPDGYALVDGQGHLIEQSRVAVEAPAYQFGTLSGGGWFGPVVFADGRRGRAVTRQCLPRAESTERDDLQPSPVTAAAAPTAPPVTLIVARDTIDLEARLRTVAGWIGGVTLVTLMTAVFASSWVARMGLVPLHQTAARIARINLATLSNPVDVGQVPAEIRSVTGALHNMQFRLAAACEREREFSSNVAHELRTPIAGMRSMIEVSLRKQRDSAAYRKSLTACLEIACELETIVEKLLVLSRIDSGAEMAELVEVDVVSLLRKLVDQYSGLAHERGLNLQFDAPQVVNLTTDPDKLALVFRNLVENAVSYASRDSNVAIECRETPAAIVFLFRNRTCGFKVSDLEKLFERFWRRDRARSEAGVHGGIGLTLSRSVAEVLGGKVSARIPDVDLIEFRLELPRP